MTAGVICTVYMLIYVLLLGRSFLNADPTDSGSCSEWITFLAGTAVLVLLLAWFGVEAVG